MNTVLRNLKFQFFSSTEKHLNIEIVPPTGDSGIPSAVAEANRNDGVRIAWIFDTD